METVDEAQQKPPPGRKSPTTSTKILNTHISGPMFTAPPAGKRLQRKMKIKFEYLEQHCPRGQIQEGRILPLGDQS